MQYNSVLFDPPCPAVDVSVEVPIATGRSVRILAQVDTGADFCVIPQRVIWELALVPYRTNRFIEHDSPVVKVKDVYRVRVAIGQLQPFMVDCVHYPFVDADDYMVLGREGLNQLRTLLEGPQQQLSFL